MKAEASGSDPAWQRAVRWLTVRDRSTAEIRERLFAAGFPPPVAEETLRRLAAAGYLDDRRYASHFAETLLRRGHGSERARASLTAKGVDDGIIESTLVTVFAEQRQHAEAVLAQRFGAYPKSPSERARAARFLSRRGFPEDLVLAILG